ncbi:hypothetical protein AB1Y20_023018 [Prymnesium parvum]|uniref:Uncharacterized protein n=1 Tax=Prymnesium parvum TaxID=97485 RepID=A0AB34JCW1_PRYPA
MEALAHLWLSAHAHVREAPELSQLLVQQMVSRAAREQLALPSRALHRICQRCSSLLVPGLDCSVKQLTHRSRPAARRCSLRVHCERCGHASTFPGAARTSSRAGQQPLPAANSGPAGGVARKSAAAQAAKAKAKAGAQSAVHKHSEVRKLAKAGAQSAVHKHSEVRKPESSSGNKREHKAAAPAKVGAEALFGFDFIPL